MVDQTNQPTILVKKTDGTTERISLSELKKRQASTASSTPVVTSMVPVVAQKPANTSMPSAPMVLPAPSVPAKMENKPILKNEDLKPLLHEVVPDSEHSKTIVVASRTDQVSKVVDSLSFKVALALDNRLRSVIQLRLKDIRSEADTLDACMRSIKDGGLGLTETQSKELTEKSKPTSYLPKVEKVANVVNKEIKENIVDKIISNAGSASAPITDLITKKLDNKPAQNMSPLRAAATNPKAMMHDVHSKPVAMGPLDEIQYFTLVDFRRLSSKPVDAAERLKQKFLNLKEESYLLFMKSWDAWRNSPLYQAYIMAVDEAVEQKRPLAGVLGERDKISLAEIEALINLEKDLAI